MSDLTLAQWQHKAAHLTLPSQAFIDGSYRDAVNAMGTGINLGAVVNGGVTGLILGLSVALTQGIATARISEDRQTLTAVVSGIAGTAVAGAAALGAGAAEGSGAASPFVPMAQIGAPTGSCEPAGA